MTGKPWEKYQTVNTADFPPVNLSAPVMPSSVDMSAPLSPMQWQEKIAPLDAPGKPWEKYQTAEPVQEVKPETGGGFAKGPGAAFAYGLNSAVPFGNVITSGLAAGALAPFTDLTFRELYDQAQADTKATREQNTGASIAGTVAGIGATLPLASAKAISGVASNQGIRGTINAIPQGLSAVGNFVRGSKVAKDAGILAKSGNLALQSLKGAAVAAPSAGIYAAGEADAGQRGEAFKSGAGLGAAIGGALPVAGAALGAGAAAAIPKVDEGLRDVAALARKYNIPLSFDQISGSRALKNMQKVSQELPFSGQENFRDAQLRAWNKEVLKRVGLDADKFTKINMDKAFVQVGHEFDSLAKGKTFQFDDAFSRSLDDIRQQAASTANRDAIANFEDAVAKALKEADPMGSISGEKLGKLRSQINQMARKASNIDTQSLLHDLENAVIDVMTEGDDLAKGALSAAKQKYKNLIVLEPLAAKAKAGNISPSQLNNRVSQVYGRAHTRGQAGEIGELAQIGYELLPELGGSDTTQKLLYAIGAGGGALANAPVTAAGLAANRAIQSGLNRNQTLIDKALTLDDVLRLRPAEAKKLLSGNIAKP